MPIKTLIPPFILVILAIVSGKIVARYAHDELKQGKRWFVLLAVLSAIGIIISVVSPISYGLKMALVYTFSFIFIVSRTSRFSAGRAWVLEHCQKCLFFLPVKTSRVRKEHF